MQQYKETCKSLNIKPGADLERYMAEVVRTKGVVIMEAQAEELIRKGTALKIEARTARENLQEAFTDAMVNEVVRIMNPRSPEGVVRMLTYDSVMYYINEISEKHHVPATSVLACMRQNVHDLYMDNRGELNRLLKLFELIQDEAMELSK